MAERVEGENRETAKKLLEKIGMQLIFRGDKFTLYVQKRPTSKGTFTLEPAKQPKEIDLISGTSVAKGIYDWEDEELKLSISPVNKDRPKDFASKPQIKQYSYILKRQKP